MTTDDFTPYECDHSSTTVRRFIASNNAIHYRVQCLTCGGRVRDIPKHERASLSPSDISAWDESIRTRWYEVQRLRWLRQLAQEQSSQRESWWAQYNEYLQSEQWAQKRVKVLQRDKTCRACLGWPASEVHHLTYAHAFNEPLFDLVGVCSLCHDAITAMDRERRQSMVGTFS